MDPSVPPAVAEPTACPSTGRLRGAAAAVRRLVGGLGVFLTRRRAGGIGLYLPLVRLDNSDSRRP